MDGTAVSQHAEAHAEAEKTSAPLSWLILIYRVPTEPTRLRATVWRKLRNLGAVYLQNSTAAIPRSPERERAMRSLRNEIVEKMDGKAYLLNARSLAGEADVVAAVNAARDDEYDEILDKCADFHAGLQKEFQAEHFTYGELEENEEDLKKLTGWYNKVRQRDSLGARKSIEVEKALAECAAHLQEFASRVYESDTDSY